MDIPQITTPGLQAPETTPKPHCPISLVTNNDFLTVPSWNPSHYAFRSRSPTPGPSRLPQMNQEPKIEVSKPFTRAEIKAMRAGIVRHINGRVQALEKAVEIKTTEVEKLQAQLSGITGLAKDAQDTLEKAAGHNKLVQESLSQVEITLRKIQKFHLGHDSHAGNNLQTMAGRLGAGEPSTKTELEGRPMTEIGGSECSSIPPTPAEGSPSHQSTESEDVADLFDFHADDGLIAKGAPKPHKPAGQKSGLQPITSSVIKISAKDGDPFAIDDAAVEAIYAGKAKGQTECPKGAASHETAVTVKPSGTAQRPAPPPSQKPTGGSAVAPFQKLADLMRLSIKDSGPALNTTTQQQAPPGSHINAAAVRGPGPNVASGASSIGPATYTARFTTLPPDFDHAGNLPGSLTTIYEEGQLCDRASYTCQRVPILRLQNIPKNVSVEEVLDNLSGGPLYRISTTKGSQDDAFKHVRITFIHLEHANAFLEFAQKNQGVYIKGCPNRIQVIQDPREKPNVISYTTFRKMMTENVTRMVFVKGLDKDFWTNTKFRDLIVAAVDKLRVEDPNRYQFKEPICERADIISTKLGIQGDEVEALIGLRSIGWAILVRTALNGLQYPEGFYMERVEGELGPSINPGDDPNSIPTLHAWWVADTVDMPLNRMPKKIDRDT
ncbi:hypothetical protein TWF281_009266 [Arthrobotrys megalospora]